MTKVSAYCLVYNHEEYLRDCLDGFVNQKTDFDYEVFVHDDASTDGSKKIIEEYAEKFPNIIKPIYQTENQYSKRIAISSTYIFPKMTGEYVAICEGDDYWCDNTKLQQQVEFLDNNPEYSACVHNTKILNFLINEEKDMYKHNEDTDIVFEDVIKRGGAAFHTSSIMYRSEYLFDRPFFFTKAKGFGDYPLAIYLATSGKIRFINKIMSVYRCGVDGSWTSKHNTGKGIIGAINFANSCIDMLNEVNVYTNYKYKEIIDNIILTRQFEVSNLSGNYKDMRRPPLKQLYDAQPLGYKLKTYIKQYLKYPYKIYRKIKYR